MKNVMITWQEYMALKDMFEKLKNTESWRGKIPTQEGFSKEDKEALNVITFVLIKPVMLPHDADLTGIPAYILKRLFRKAYTWDAKPNNTEYLRKNIQEFDAKLEAYVRKTMVSRGIGDFARFIWDEAGRLSPEVLKVYKAARVLGTLIEYEEVCDQLRPDTNEETRQRIYNDLLQFADLPHFMDIAHGLGKYRELKTLLRAISASRYTFRWQGYIAPVRCSILAHMLESAMIGYLANLETGRETDILQDFWVLMFHDLSEIWSDDIPSPVKDGMEIDADGTTLRGVTEQQELQVLEEYFYSSLPDNIAEFFRNGVMLEDVDDAMKKRFYKAADYFSADLEVWWNIKAGSRELAFKKILERSVNGNRTPAQKELLKNFVRQCEAVTFFE